MKTILCLVVLGFICLSFQIEVERRKKKMKHSKKSRSKHKINHRKKHKRKLKNRKDKKSNATLKLKKTNNQ